MKILVTGATGFVGGHLARGLLEQNHEVHIVTRPGTDLSKLGEARQRVVSHTHNGSTEDMIALVREARPVAVMHLASLFLGEHKSDDVEGLVQSNVLFSTQLAEAMAANSVTKIINVGTSWQHYEDDDYNPVNLYAATKQAFRAMLKYYIEVFGFRVINLELFDTYGPNDQRGKLFALLDNLRKGGDTIGMSPGAQRLDPIYIDDVTEAFIIALERLESGSVSDEETYSVGSGRSIQLRELVKIYEDETGVTLNIEWGGRPYRTREVMQPWSRGVALPGWSPRTSLREGIRRILQADV
jgi:nucleoside-diphosphate-sugar epimerase